MVRWTMIVFAALAACSGGAGTRDDAGPAEDSGPADAAVDAPVSVIPTLPAKVTMAPCPPSWRELPLEGAEVRCEPWPATGMATCPLGETHVPGRPECAPVGELCTGPFPVLPGNVLVKYVRPGPGPGLGTLADPYPTIGAAIPQVSAGWTIAVSEGDFDENVTLPPGVTLRGSCSRTRLAPTSGKVAITVSGAGNVVRDLSITGTATHTGINVKSFGLLMLHGVTISGVKIGITVEPSGELSATSLLLANITGRGPPGPPTDPPPAALDVHGMATLERSVIRQSSYAARIATGGLLRLRNSAVVESGHDFQTENPHVAVEVQNMGFFWAEGVAFERNYGQAVLLAAGGTATLDGTLVRDMQGPPGYPERGGIATKGGAFNFERLLVEGTDRAIRCIDCQLRARHVAVVNSGSAYELSGFTANLGGPLLALRAGGVTCSDSQNAADLQLSDVTVIGRSGTLGLGVIGHRSDLITPRSAAVTVRRLLVDGAGLYGAAAFGEGGLLRLEDATIRGTREQDCVTSTCPELVGVGTGVGSYGRAGLEARRFLIEGNLLVGAQVGPNATMDLHEGAISMNPIGANIQNPGLDPARLSDRVLYKQNAANLDASQLTLPPPPGLLP